MSDPKLYAVYHRGKSSGFYYRAETYGTDEEDAKDNFLNSCGHYYEVLAVEDANVLHNMEPEERVRYLLRQGTANSPEGQSHAAAPACGAECWRDPQTHPIDADHAIRMVRLACGGDPDKGRR